MNNQKSGNSEFSVQLLVLLVPWQPEMHRDFHRFSQEIAILHTSGETVVDFFNKKMEPGNRMSEFKQPLTWF